MHRQHSLPPCRDTWAEGMEVGVAAMERATRLHLQHAPASLAPPTRPSPPEVHSELAVECMPRNTLAVASVLGHLMPDSSNGTLQSGLEGLMLSATD